MISASSYSVQPITTTLLHSCIPIHTVVTYTFPSSSIQKALCSYTNRDQHAEATAKLLQKRAANSCPKRKESGRGLTSNGVSVANYTLAFHGWSLRVASGLQVYEEGYLVPSHRKYWEDHWYVSLVVLLVLCVHRVAWQSSRANSIIHPSSHSSRGSKRINGKRTPLRPLQNAHTSRNLHYLCRSGNN